MATLNISLPDAMRDFVEQEVSSGHYSSASEYLRQLIREDQKRRARERLDAIIAEGLDSPTAPMTPQDWQDIRAQVAQRLAARQP